MSQLAPVFLVGSERSGTTLLRLMLDHHPRIAFHFEFDYVVEPLAAWPEERGWPPLAVFHRHLDASRLFLQSGFTIDPGLSYRELALSLLEQKRARAGKPLVGATVHHAFDQLPRLWPDARYIHLVRDARDVAHSIGVMGWAGSAWEAAGWWLEAEATWDRLAAGCDPARRIELRYEDLVRDPRAALAELCAFIGVAFDPAMFDYARTTSYRLPDAGRAQRWRETLDARAIRLVEGRAGRRLTSLGYGLSGLDPLQPGRLGRLGLRLVSRARRSLFRLRRYGPRLFLMDFLARRLGLEAKGIRRALHEIELRQLQ